MPAGLSAMKEEKEKTLFGLSLRGQVSTGHWLCYKKMMAAAMRLDRARGPWLLASAAG